MASKSSILRPNRGLWLNQASIAIPQGALSAGHNFRIQNGKLSNINLGWTRFGDWQLNGPVTLVDSYFDRTSAQTVIFGTPTDLYQYDAGTDTVAYLTPIEVTGTVDVSAADPAVVAENTSTSDWDTIGIKAGDEISFGSASETDPDATWYVIASVDNDDQLTLETAVAGAPLTGSDFTIRRLFTGSLNTPWEGVTFLHEASADEDLYIATNGVDDIVTWNGSDASAEFAGLGFKAYHLNLFKNMVVASAITDTGEFFPSQIRNSDPGSPLNFTTGLASALTAHDGSDEVSAAIPLGDSLVLYSERHIVISDFVGDPFIFVLRDAVPNLGPISGRLVGDFGDEHVFIGPDAQYSFDGATVQESGNQAFRDLLRKRDPTRTLRAWSHFDEENGDLIWAVPLIGDDDTSAGPRRSYVDHYLEETKGDITPVSSRDMPFTASGFFERQTTLTWDQISDMWEDLNFRWNDIFFSAAFPFNLMGDADGYVYTLNTAQTGNGAALDSFVRTGRFALGDGFMRGLLARVYPFATEFASNVLHVRTRMFDSANGPLQFVDEVDFALDMDDGMHFASIFRAGRFFELEFHSDGGAWELAGWDVEVRPGGYR